jgi:hypothetical protein
MRVRNTLIGVAGTLACVAGGASVALGAGSSKPAGGPIQLFVQPGQNQGNGKILITGAVGDYGSSSPTKSINGKKIGLAHLTKGTIVFDLSAISAKVDKASPTINTATCSGSLTESAPAAVTGGSGLYSGIHGTIQITESFGFIGSDYTSGPKKGQCNMSNSSKTVAEMGTVYGSGNVSF